MVGIVRNAGRAVLKHYVGAVDGVIVLFNICCIGAAIGIDISFKGGGRVDILLILIGQHHSCIAQMVFDEVVIHKAAGGIGGGGIGVLWSYPPFFLRDELQPVGIVRAAGIGRGGCLAFKHAASQVGSGGGGGVVAIGGGRVFNGYFFELVAQVIMCIADGAFVECDDLGQLCRAPVFDAVDAFVKIGSKAAIAVVVIIIICRVGTIPEIAQLIG